MQEDVKVEEAEEEGQEIELETKEEETNEVAVESKDKEKSEDADDVSEYSESVKKRISKLTNRFREEERQRISNAQKVALYAVNESKRVLKKIREEVSTLALLHKNTLKLSPEDIKSQMAIEKEMLEDVDRNYSYQNMKTKIRKNKKFQDNNYDVEPDNSI